MANGLPLLLAYLDGTLDVSAAQQVETTLAEDRDAARRVHRIGDVMRRLRLGAPDINDAAEDANRVGAWLDQTLRHDEAELFESWTLECDARLAEVAACHQILAIVLGEPANVPTDSRRRMYQILSEPDTTPTRTAKRPALPPEFPGEHEAKPIAAKGVGHGARPGRRTARGRFLRWLARRKPRTLETPWRFLTVLVVLVLFGWAALNLTPASRRMSGKPLRTAAGPAVLDGEPTTESMSTQFASSPEQARPVENAMSTESTLSTLPWIYAATEAATEAPATAPPPDWSTEPTSPESFTLRSMGLDDPAVAVSDPPGLAVTRPVAATRPTAPMPTDPAPARDPAVPASPTTPPVGVWANLLKSTSEALSGELLFARPLDDTTWQVMQQGPCHAGWLYAAPAGFRPLLILDNGIRIEVLDGARFSLGAPDAQGTPTLLLEEGRLLVSTSPPTMSDRVSPTHALHLRFDTYGWDIEGSDPTARRRLRPIPREGVLVLHGPDARAEIEAIVVADAADTTHLHTQVHVTLRSSHGGDARWHAPTLEHPMRSAGHAVWVPVVPPGARITARVVPPEALDRFGRSREVLPMDVAQQLRGMVVAPNIPLCERLKETVRHAGDTRVQRVAAQCLFLMQASEGPLPGMRWTRYPASVPN